MNTLLEALVYGAIAALISGTVLPLLYRSKNTRKTSFGLSLLSSILLLGFAGALLYTGKEPVFPPIRYLPGLDFTLVADRLSAGFILLIAAVVPGVSIYSVEYVEHAKSEAGKNLQTALTNLFILAMLMVVLAGNMVIFLIFWEIMSLSSLLLVLHDYSSEENKKAGFFYFVMTNISTAFLFVGFISLFRLTGSADFGPLEYSASELALPFLSLFIGFGVKAGLVPFHKWLPYAHPAAPSSVSALMSGVMLKVAVYGFLRFLLSVFTPELWWGVLIITAGSLSALFGVIYALKENDIKRLLAYSSIENIGIIFTGIGLYVIFKVEGLESLALLSLAGACFHAFNHALFKSLLFLCAGSIVHATGTRKIEAFGGLVKTMPATTALFMIGSVSIAALPPTNGFAGELLLYQAFFQSFAVTDPLLTVFLITALSSFALTGALAAALFVKLFGITCLALPRSEKSRLAEEVQKPMLIGPAVPAALCILAGLFSKQLLSFAGWEIEFPDLLLLGLLLGLIYAALFLIIRSKETSPARISETWGCGIPTLAPHMEYSSAGFSEPLVMIFKNIYRTKIVHKAEYHDKQESLFKNGNVEIRLLRFFEEYLYIPPARAIESFSKYVSSLQNGKLDSYILYAFLAVIVLIIATGGFV
ncbi:MAG: proton-conducting transporter membrane subunit [Methanosarcina sp.]|uniref:proton-conducting transporter transmembrane domain-containing protein n=1 Tax=Methanosarcina sp. TaxID=2213 RepID=UPI002612E8F5|nr:proton-conducting transporter membrane subunit [Methanosarcina sp.]MDD3245275.1 proton-conducting transporter membrane subunit [Methanosarcina sp.]MDD4250319.1 proton-conducting transporter membrane subunit [Methanosarcina sp.]